MHSRQGPPLLLLAAILSILCVGCTPEDAAGLKIDFSQLNWQTGVIIALALLINPGKIVGTITEQLGKIPALEKILRLVGLIGSGDSSPGTLTQAETLEALVAIVNRLPPSPLRDELAALLAKAATVPEVKPDAK
ncbi:MAG: hypothetical protein ACRCXD_03885 [Luteolibacter sp.]